MTKGLYTPGVKLKTTQKGKMFRPKLFTSAETQIGDIKTVKTIQNDVSDKTLRRFWGTKRQSFSSQRS